VVSHFNIIDGSIFVGLYIVSPSINIPEYYIQIREDYNG